MRESVNMFYRVRVIVHFASLDPGDGTLGPLCRSHRRGSLSFVVRGVTCTACHRLLERGERAAAEESARLSSEHPHAPKAG